MEMTPYRTKLVKKHVAESLEILCNAASHGGRHKPTVAELNTIMWNLREAATVLNDPDGSASHAEVIARIRERQEA
jgi:hypothetical protein